MNSICYCQYFGCFITCCVREGALICHVFRRGHFTQDVSESFCIHKKQNKKTVHDVIFINAHADSLGEDMISSLVQCDTAKPVM